jgi:hypothetical protein
MHQLAVAQGFRLGGAGVFRRPRPSVAAAGDHVRLLPPRATFLTCWPPRQFAAPGDVPLIPHVSLFLLSVQAVEKEPMHVCKFFTVIDN